MKYSIDDVLKVLSNVKDPDSGKDLVSLNAINALEVDDKKISFSLNIPAGSPFLKSIEKACKKVLQSELSTDIDIQIKSVPKIEAKKISLGRTDDQKVLPGVKNILAVASGKGQAADAAVRDPIG